MSSIASDTFSGTVEGAWGAVQAPFEDLNLLHHEIPEKLQQVAKAPYAPPIQMDCFIIAKELAELDLLLGPDVCTINNPTGDVSRKGEYVEQGAGIARKQAVDIVSDKVNIIPFRGMVRKISGADKHSKAVERAYEAGRMRRAFLKGLQLPLNCNPVIP